MNEIGETKPRISNLETTIKAWVAGFFTLLVLYFLISEGGSLLVSGWKLSMLVFSYASLLPFVAGYCISEAYRKKSSRWGYVGIITPFAFLAVYSYAIIPFITSVLKVLK